MILTYAMILPLYRYQPVGRVARGQASGNAASRPGCLSQRSAMARPPHSQPILAEIERLVSGENE